MFRQKIRKAMRLLDERAPGWRAKVDRAKLDMSRATLDFRDCGCVLAQTHGSYTIGLRALGLSEGTSNGFSIGVVECRRVSASRVYRQLTQEWREELRRESSAQ